MILPADNNRTEQWLKTFSWMSAVVVLGFFTVLFLDIAKQGMDGMGLDYFFSAPMDAGREGGIGPMLVSTLLLLLICLGISLPIGIASAIYLAEYTNETEWFARIIQTSLNVLASVPSIVMGLFGYAFFVIAMGLGFSLLSGGLTLACMVLPLLIRNIEDSLRNIPDTYRINASALGLSQFRTILNVLLPMAIPGILLAVIISISRAMAETAALLYTSGYVTRMPDSVMDSGRSLSIHIFDLSMNVPGGEQSAYRSALTLIFLLLIINITTNWLSNKLQKRSFR